MVLDAALKIDAFNMGVPREVSKHPLMMFSAEASATLPAASLEREAGRPPPEKAEAAGPGDQPKIAS